MKITELFIDAQKRPVEGNELLYDFSESSQSAEFYKKQFSVSDISTSIKDTAGKPVPPEMRSVMDLLKKELSKDAIVVELGGSWHQNRSGYPHTLFPNYIPVDISFSSMDNYTRLFSGSAVVSNAERLPFKDNSIDAIFTHAFLEHPIHPENVVAEVVRILKPGGIVVHCDAWHCRWWQRYGIVGVKKFGQMSFKEKMIYCSARITEAKVFRFTRIVLNRLFAELFRSKKGTKGLRYKKLDPNYDLHLYCDEDAASSLDPLNVIRFYESKGFIALTPLSFFQRIFYRSMDIRLKKI